MLAGGVEMVVPQGIHSLTHGEGCTGVQNLHGGAVVYELEGFCHGADGEDKATGSGTGNGGIEKNGTLMLAGFAQLAARDFMPVERSIERRVAECGDSESLRDWA